MEKKFYLTKTGEALRIISDDGAFINMSAFEEFILQGPSLNFEGFKEACGMTEITELEYKRRVVAMRFFQDCKNDKDYPHKTYLGQYEEQKEFLKDESVESFFEIGGGYRADEADQASE